MHHVGILYDLYWQCSEFRMQQLFRPANSCSDLSAAVQACQQLYSPVSSCSDLPTAVQSCQQLFRHANSCSDLPTAVQTCQQLFRPANSCSDLPTAVQSSIFTRKEELMSENLGYFMMNANSQMNDNPINSMISKKL